MVADSSSEHCDPDVKSDPRSAALSAVAAPGVAEHLARSDQRSRADFRAGVCSNGGLLDPITPLF